MIRRLFVLSLLSIIVIGGSASVRPTQSANPESCAQDHETWLKQVLEKMETIKPGMTRLDLLHAYRAEGGPSRVKEDGLLIGLRQTYVRQDFPYFKIDVEFDPFEPSTRPPCVSCGLVRWGEDNRDVIVKVSKPYVQFATTNEALGGLTPESPYR